MAVAVLVKIVELIQDFTVPPESIEVAKSTMREVWEILSWINDCASFLFLSESELNSSL